MKDDSSSIEYVADELVYIVLMFIVISFFFLFITIFLQIQNDLVVMCYLYEQRV